jgi:hypothetical protein
LGYRARNVTRFADSAEHPHGGSSGPWTEFFRGFRTAGWLLLGFLSGNSLESLCKTGLSAWVVLAKSLLFICSLMESVCQPAVAGFFESIGSQG